MVQPVGMLRQQRRHELLESRRDLLLLRRTKCPLAWGPRSGLELPLIRALSRQVSIRQPVIQLVLAQVLSGGEKKKKRILSNRSELLTVMFAKVRGSPLPFTYGS